MNKTHVGIDAKRAFFNTSGLGNYSRRIISALLLNDNIHVHLFTPKKTKQPFYKAMKNHPQVTIHLPNGLWKVIPGLWRRCGIQFVKLDKKLDVFHGLSNEIPVGCKKIAKKTVVTIHDLLFFKAKLFYRLWDILIYTLKTKHAVTIADCVVAISNQTAEDLKKYLPKSRDKIAVVYQPYKLVAKELPQKDLSISVPEPYILQVGTMEVRKNIQATLEAVNILKDKIPHTLVCVGRKTRFVKSIKDYAVNQKIKSRLCLLHKVCDTELHYLYKNAALVVYPSKMEGFGLPILEAVSYNKAIITTKGGCFQESGGPCAMYTDTENPELYANIILQALTDNHSCDNKKRKEHLSQFQPDVIGKTLINIYTQ